MPDFTVSDYESALNTHRGDVEGIEIGLESFRESYSDLTQPELGKRIENLYAERLYFNDTVHTFHTRDELRDYLVRTGEGLEESSVEIRQVVQDEEDVFVRWTMEFRTRVAGKKIHSHSIGITQLRFDEQGRIVFHQDFWDSGSALYAHLPFVGFAVRSARSRM